MVQPLPGTNRTSSGSTRASPITTPTRPGPGEPRPTTKTRTLDRAEVGWMSSPPSQPLVMSTMRGRAGPDRWISTAAGSEVSPTREPHLHRTDPRRLVRRDDEVDLREARRAGLPSWPQAAEDGGSHRAGVVWAQQALPEGDLQAVGIDRLGVQARYNHDMMHVFAAGGEVERHEVGRFALKFNLGPARLRRPAVGSAPGAVCARPTSSTGCPSPTCRAAARRPRRPTPGCLPRERCRLPRCPWGLSCNGGW